MDARVKAVRIKAGVVKRIAREAVVYRKEAETQRIKGEKAIAEGADSHKIDHDKRLLDEALMMVPDADRRLKKAHAELKELLDGEQDIKETDEYKEALKILEDSAKQIEENERANA